MGLPTKRDWFLVQRNRERVQLAKLPQQSKWMRSRKALCRVPRSNGGQRFRQPPLSLAIPASPEGGAVFTGRRRPWFRLATSRWAFSGRPAEALLPRSDPRRVAARYCYPASFSFAVPSPGFGFRRTPPESGSGFRLSPLPHASSIGSPLPSASAAFDPFEPRPPAASGSALELLPFPVDPLPGTNGECHRQPSRATEISLWITRITGIISVAFCLCQGERRRLPVMPGTVLSRTLARLARSANAPAA